MNTERQKWILLVVLSVIWGSSFILIKKSLDHFSPYQVGALRVLISGIVLMPYAITKIKNFPRKQIPWLIIAGIAGSFIPMFLFPMAETEISSSIAGIINSMMPIFVIIVGSLVWKIPTNNRQVIGVCISFFGVCLLTIGSGENGELKIYPILLLVVAVLLYAISTTTIKSKLQMVPATMLSAYLFSFVLFLPSLVALIFSGFFSNDLLASNTLQGLGFVSLLSVFGTGLAMMMNYKLLSISTPLFASTVTLIMPIIAIIWGILDGESLSLIQVVGTIIILTGLIFLRNKPKPYK